ncbi:MAG: hypothetical protein K0S35_3346 [Geminicoccaceae bacterium]|nr:hypothetical protein [Geminicoccaceae bacterium]
MNRNIPVRSGWDIGEVGFRNLAPPSLPTMADTGEIDLRGFLRTIYRRKWMLLSTMGACMGATMVWLSYATPSYDAEVLIVVEARPASIVRVDERVQDLISDGAEVNTEVAVLESRGLASRVIRDLELDRDPEFTEEAGPRGDPAAGASGAATPSGGIPAKVLSNAITEALNSLRALLANAWAGVNGADALAPEQMEREEPANTRLLEVSEGREAAALLERFLERLTVTPEEESRLIRIAFTSTDPAKAALIANRLVDEYLESQLETKTEGARRAAEWLEVRLAELGKTVRSLEQSVQQQRAETGSNGIDIVSPRLAQINLQLIDAQAASASSRARYEQVRSVVEGGGNLDALPEILHSPIVQPLRAKYTELVATLSERRTIFGENHPQIVSLRAEIAGIEQRLARDIGSILAGLRNEMETDKTNEATLRRALEAASEDVVRLKASETAIAQVAQRLQANQDLYRNLLERFTEAVALRDNQQPDARIISPAQIPLDPSFPNFPRFIVLSFVASTSLGLFVLVIAERLRQKLDTVDSVERHVGLPIIGTIPELPRRRRLASSPAGYLQRHPLSEFGGAFQRLRALLNLGRAMPRTVLVTSGSAGEGKTTVAMCLGIASALSGQRVLLVDCNFARPEVHRKANVKNKSGLTDVLRGLVPLEDTITLAAEYQLSILTIGRSREGALDEWTKHRDAFYAAKQLQLSGADVAGVVFNRAEP